MVFGSGFGNWTCGHERYELTTDGVALEKGWIQLDMRRFREILEHGAQSKSLYETLAYIWSIKGIGGLRYST